MCNLADTLMRMHDYAGGEALFQQALEAQRRVLGPEHPQTIITMRNLAEALTMAHDYAQAEKVLKPAIDIERRVLGPDHPNTALSTYSLACIEARLGHGEEALSLIRASLDHGLPLWTAKTISTEPDFESLHSDPRFEALVAHAKELTAATPKSN